MTGATPVLDPAVWAEAPRPRLRGAPAGAAQRHRGAKAAAEARGARGEGDGRRGVGGRRRKEVMLFFKGFFCGWDIKNVFEQVKYSKLLYN